ncbi:MAG: glutaredoxin family protein [Ignavibacteriales bacterium]|nr:glutaredoxin family protein [Ignavibacteriales bacterium]
MTVAFYSKDDCKLCDNARNVIKRLKKEFFFDVNETMLTEEHPRYKEFFMAIPVVIIQDKQFSGTILEDDLRAFLKELKPPTRLFYLGKTLEALGFLTVALGLMYGLMGDMWTDLYFFLGGIVVFGVGMVLERRELRRDRQPSV